VLWRDRGEGIGEFSFWSWAGRTRWLERSRASAISAEEQAEGEGWRGERARGDGGRRRGFW